MQDKSCEPVPEKHLRSHSNFRWYYSISLINFLHLLRSIPSLFSCRVRQAFSTMSLGRSYTLRPPLRNRYIFSHSHSHPFLKHAHTILTYVAASLWPPYVIGQAIIFLPCGFFFYLLSFFPRLISDVADWMSTIGLLPHMVWP